MQDLIPAFGLFVHAHSFVCVCACSPVRSCLFAGVRVYPVVPALVWTCVPARTCNLCACMHLQACAPANLRTCNLCVCKPAHLQPVRLHAPAYSIARAHASWQITPPVNRTVLLL